MQHQINKIDKNLITMLLKNTYRYFSSKQDFIVFIDSKMFFGSGRYVDWNKIYKKF